jgi:hypothetical protein
VVTATVVPVAPKETPVRQTPTRHEYRPRAIRLARRAMA